ncbi:MAG TPA: alpha/beta fold hydrolase [Candidatus Saccharimonadales bacterium]|nr:alpha/beta fold hydrolase [Candidatus Saccharimonadales bacterium]
MKLELVSFETADGIGLPGLLFRPDKDTKKAAVWLHGMGDNAVFYNPGFINAIGRALTDKGMAFLAFHNRGAHSKKSLKYADETLPEEDRRYQGGTYYELIADCVKDIDGAAGFMKEQGFTTLYLAGHSTGANKICAYHARARQNPFSKYVLAGPGDDTGLMFAELGAKKFWSALKYAAKSVESDPFKVMPKYTGMYPFSVQSARDIMDPDGAYNTFPFYEAAHERIGNKPLFEEYGKVDRPTLVIIGAQDEYTEHVGGADKALKLFMKHTSNTMLKKIDFAAVPGADHGFKDVEAVFAKQMADWLAYE